MSLLLRRVWHEGDLCDMLIVGNRFAEIAPAGTLTAATDAEEPQETGGPTGPVEVIDAGARLAIVPPFYNGHTHAAMTLLRGFAEDLSLGDWLNNHIWPAEAELTAEDVYAGSRLAILEMIKSGTVFFNDMYWEQPATARAAVELGVRAELGLLYIDTPDGTPVPRSQQGNTELLDLAPTLPDRVSIAHAPHAPYSVSRATLEHIAELAAADGRRVHTHAAETAAETAECFERNGLSPIAYLDSLGLVGPRTILAHCVHLDDHDRDLLASKQAVVAHMAVSNLKLCSGFFEHEKATTAGCRIILGTDGAASNNSLSMFGEMKTAALLAKSQAGSPLAGRDDAMLAAATVDSARAFGIDAGEIAPGRLADALLVDVDHPAMVADHSLVANLVYAADPGVIDTVICDGRVLMRERVVDGEADIVAAAREASLRVRERGIHRSRSTPSTDTAT